MNGRLPAYAELHCVSNFSFLRGASHPHELVERACELGYQALAITDECSLAGVVRAHRAAKTAGLPLLIGSEFVVEAMPSCRLVVLACHREGYGHLSAFITGLRRASAKGTYRLRIDDIEPADLDDCVLLWVPDRLASFDSLLIQAQWWRNAFADRLWIAVELLHAVDDKVWLQRVRDLGRQADLPLVAAGAVHMHVRSRKPLQDVLTATRIGQPLTACGEALQPNAEQHLRSRLRLSLIYPSDLLQATLDVAARCDFSLDELR
ncbi:MAG: PHP domain-containing protein, partial [Burkholderiales bacterium]|nr:PHP domain-containing protein [Burkholderiales bacterium]